MSVIAELPTDAEQKARWAEIRPFVGGISVSLHGTGISTGCYLIKHVYFARTLGL